MRRAHAIGEKVWGEEEGSRRRSVIIKGPPDRGCDGVM